MRRREELSEAEIFHVQAQRRQIRHVDLQMDALNARLADKQLRCELTPEAKQFIIDAAYDPQFGARPLRRLIQRTVEDTLSEELLGGKIALGDRVRLKVTDGKITVEKEA